MQRDFGLAADLHRAAILPVPCGALGAEGGAERLAVDEHLEPARRARRFPRRDPIARADPDAVLAGGGKLHGGLRVAHRLAQPVRQQIGRAHLVHELLVHHPAAEVGELLGFEQDHAALWSGLGSQPEGQKEQEEHAAAGSTDRSSAASAQAL